MIAIIGNLRTHSHSKRKGMSLIIFVFGGSMKKYLLLLCLSSALSLSAALPPLYQSSNEIKAILSSESLGSALSAGELITTIQKNKQGYEITTNRRHVQVDIVYEPNQKPGPAQFKLQFHEATPLQEFSEINE